MTEFTGAFPAPTWTPPAREPFVPLRPLTLGQVLAGSFRALRHNPAVTLGPAIVISLLAMLASTTFGLFVIAPLITASGSSIGPAGPAMWLAGFGASTLGWIVDRAFAQGAGALQQGVSAVDISHAVVGRRLTPGGLRRRTRGIRAPLIGWTVIVVLATTVVGGLALAALGLVAAYDPVGGVVAGFLIYPLVGVLLAWIGTKLAVVPSALVIERLRLGAGIRRSWRLTRRNFWRVFGIRILTWAMIWMATALVAIPVQLLVQWLTGILAGNGDISDSLAISDIGSIVTAIVAAVIGAIGLVITTSTDAILYLDLRMRHEGLDLELGRFMEQRRATTRFDPAEPDPYRPPADVAPRQIRPAVDTEHQGSAWG
ncbi:MAG: hypothetical protein DI534_08110 [Leifsonia xyli]|nr:MAG: hypothetical protein DI534_08110 [Leifsonia xyli]